MAKNLIFSKDSSDNNVIITEFINFFTQNNPKRIYMRTQEESTSHSYPATKLSVYGVERIVYTLTNVYDRTHSCINYILQFSLGNNEYLGDEKAVYVSNGDTVVFNENEIEVKASDASLRFALGIF